MWWSPCVLFAGADGRQQRWQHSPSTPANYSPWRLAPLRLGLRLMAVLCGAVWTTLPRTGLASTEGAITLSCAHWCGWFSMPRPPTISPCAPSGSPASRMARRTTCRGTACRTGPWRPAWGPECATTVALGARPRPHPRCGNFSGTLRGQDVSQARSCAMVYVCTGCVERVPCRRAWGRGPASVHGTPPHSGPGERWCCRFRCDGCPPAPVCGVCAVVV